MHPLIRCISILLLYIVYTVLSLSPYQTVMIQCRSLTLYTTTLCIVQHYYVCMYSILLLDAIHTYYPLSMCMHTVPLLDSVHTHRETQCVALCVVSSCQTLHIHEDYQCLFIVLCMVSYCQILHITQQMQCAISIHCSMCGIPLLDTTHTTVCRYSTLHKELMVQCNTGASCTYYYVCAYVVSPYYILYIHIHSMLLCVLSLCQTTPPHSAGGGGMCWEAMHTGASRTQDYVYSYVCHPLIRWHT